VAKSAKGSSDGIGHIEIVIKDDDGAFAPWSVRFDLLTPQRAGAWRKV